MSFVMKTLVLNSIIVCLSVTTAFGQSQSDVEFLRARADAHERKISQLEQDLSRLKALLAEKPTAQMAAKPKQAPKAPAVAAKEPAANSYVVKQGDMLSRIAASHETSVAAILKENNLPNDRIIVGQKLLIPGSAASVSSSTQVSCCTCGEKLSQAPSEEWRDLLLHCPDSQCIHEEFAGSKPGGCADQNVRRSDFAN